MQDSPKRCKCELERAAGHQERQPKELEDHKEYTWRQQMIQHTKRARVTFSRAALKERVQQSTESISPILLIPGHRY